MKIKHDKGYLNLWKDMKDAGFTNERISRLDFDGMEEEKAKELLDWLEENFIVYQYKNRTREQYKKHELFFWSNGSLDYFRISFNDENGYANWDKWLDKILNHITENHPDTKGLLSLHYQNCINWDKVNNYIQNTNFDINNLPLDKLRIITKNGGSKGRTVVGSLLSDESKEILYQLEKELLKSLVDKKVFYNGVKGTIRKIDDNMYGFFKLRARKNYYWIRLENIRSLEIA